MKLKNIREPDIIGSYSREDVTFLLKDISDIIQEQDNEQREDRVQNGGHYSEMLPIEYFPTEEYMDIFYKTLIDTKERVAKATAIVAELIYKEKGESVVIVSLARAGTPIGILIKRYLEFKYNIKVSHYSISIIRGKGIDENALKYIINKHNSEKIQFIDGWTGKGAINSVLNEAILKFNYEYDTRISDRLAVIADPACCVELYGTREDFLIPSACLNSTVSGLVSRTVLRDDIISKNDFHGAKFYKEWLDKDLSNSFIETITECFSNVAVDKSYLELVDSKIYNKGIKEVKEIKEKYNIENINLIKPGIGETTRVLLRRIPWKILVSDENNPDLKHILVLARDKQVPVEIYKDMSYSCCGLIKSKKKENIE